MKKIEYIIKAAIIGAIYASLTYLLKPISYGPIQVRVSEALTLIPLIDSSSVLGLFAGCMIANILGGLGPWDIYGGSLITLIAAYLTSRMPNEYLGALWPIILNAFGVSYYLSFLYHMPYWITVLYIAVGEAIAVIFLGIPLIRFIKKSGLIKYFKK
ncbi:MAG: QueT transporter family protein [Thermovenabulum sp.]|uniref:QueT transporter family protein n=1 Tax=Thermovenabulum sp. TaxID=3100335 RepID=UPI003C7A292C